MEIVIAIGAVLVILAFIMVPVITARKRKGNFSKHEAFLEKLAIKTKTTPTPEDDGIMGKYKGYKVETNSRLWIGNTRQEHASGQKIIKRLRKWNTFNPHLTVLLTDPEANFPELAIWDDLKWIPKEDMPLEERKERKPELNKMALDTTVIHQKGNVYGEDASGARKLLEDKKLKHLLKTWHCTDIRTKGTQVTVTLDNPKAYEKFHSRLKSPSYIIQAMELAVATAEALKKQ